MLRAVFSCGKAMKSCTITRQKPAKMKQSSVVIADLFFPMATVKIFLDSLTLLSEIYCWRWKETAYAFMLMSKGNNARKNTKLHYWGFDSNVYINRSQLEWCIYTNERQRKQERAECILCFILSTVILRLTNGTKNLPRVQRAVWSISYRRADKEKAECALTFVSLGSARLSSFSLRASCPSAVGYSERTDFTQLAHNTSSVSWCNLL